MEHPGTKKDLREDCMPTSRWPTENEFNSVFVSQCCVWTLWFVWFIFFLIYVFISHFSPYRCTSEWVSGSCAFTFPNACLFCFILLYNHYRYDVFISVLHYYILFPSYPIEVCFLVREDGFGRRQRWSRTGTGRTEGKP